MEDRVPSQIFAPMDESSPIREQSHNLHPRRRTNSDYFSECSSTSSMMHTAIIFFPSRSLGRNTNDSMSQRSTSSLSRVSVSKLPSTVGQEPLRGGDNLNANAIPRNSTEAQGEYLFTANEQDRQETLPQSDDSKPFDEVSFPWGANSSMDDDDDDDDDDDKPSTYHDVMDGEEIPLARHRFLVDQGDEGIAKRRSCMPNFSALNLRRRNRSSPHRPKPGKNGEIFNDIPSLPVVSPISSKEDGKLRRKTEDDGDGIVFETIIHATDERFTRPSSILSSSQSSYRSDSSSFGGFSLLSSDPEGLQFVDTTPSCLYPKPSFCRTPCRNKETGLCTWEDMKHFSKSCGANFSIRTCLKDGCHEFDAAALDCRDELKDTYDGSLCLSINR